MADIEQLASREIYRSPWLRLRADDVAFADGSRGTYTVVEKQDFVVVLPYADDGFWLVQQYRYPVASRQWEFPQGGWTAGRSGTVEELAAAELAEETGLQAGTFVHLGRMFAAYGYSSQAFDVFRATELTPGTPHREVSEQDMVHRWFAAADVRDMVVSGELADSHSVAALMLDDLRR